MLDKKPIACAARLAVYMDLDSLPQDTDMGLLISFLVCLALGFLLFGSFAIAFAVNVILFGCGMLAVAGIKAMASVAKD